MDTFRRNRSASDADIHQSCWLGDATHLSALVEKEGLAAINGEDFFEAPLAVAAAQGHLEVMRLLIALGANVEAEDALGVRPLNRAATAGQLDACKLLLDMGASIDSMDSINGAPLHGAAKRGHTHICKMLIKRGAAVDARNDAGETPLFNASQLGHTDTIRALLAGGADPYAKTTRGQTPFGAARGSWIGERQAKAVCDLLEHGGGKALTA